MSAMSEIRMTMDPGESRMTALLAMLKYVSDELGTIDAISQFCVDMAIHQLSDRARSMMIPVNISDDENVMQ